VAEAALMDAAQAPMNSEVIMDSVQVAGMEWRMRRYLLSSGFLK
uniref:Zinc finger protein 772 n=1 Tax=Rhinolophus ferrumequinum TaxID=59479 RepID=A0A671E8E8_RHIFE